MFLHCLCCASSLYKTISLSSSQWDFSPFPLSSEFRAVVFYFILLVLVIFLSFGASSKVLLPFTVPLRSDLAGPDRCKFFCPAVDVRQESEVRFGARKLQDSRSGRLSENITGTRIKITLLPKYSANKKPDDERIICQSLDAYRKSPQSPADTLLPCIINQWQLCSPMDST